MTLTPKQINKMIQLKAEGYTDRDVANKVKVSLSSVKKYKKKYTEEIAETKKQLRKDPSEKFLSVENNNDLHAKVEKNREMILKVVDVMASESFTAPFVGCINEWLEDDRVQSLAEYQIEIWKHIFDMDPGVGKKLLLKHKPYQVWIESIDSFENREETIEYKNYLVYWIRFVNKHCPEFLDDFKEFI